jgi:glycosyltransferase involved in cell wall biosynthesis
MRILHVLSIYSESSAGYRLAIEQSYKHTVFLLSRNGLFEINEGSVMGRYTWSRVQIFCFRFFNNVNIFFNFFHKYDFFILNSPLIDQNVVVDCDEIIVHNSLNGFISLYSLRKLFKFQRAKIFLHDFSYLNYGIPHFNTPVGVFRRFIFFFNNGTIVDLARSWDFIAPSDWCRNEVLRHFSYANVAVEPNVINEKLLLFARPNFYLLGINYTKVLVFTYGKYKGRKFTQTVIELLEKENTLRKVLLICVGEDNYSFLSTNSVHLLKLPMQSHSDIIGLMKACDIVMINSDNETFGIVAFEAHFLNKLIFARDHLPFKAEITKQVFYYSTPSSCVTALMEHLNVK